MHPFSDFVSSHTSNIASNLRLYLLDINIDHLGQLLEAATELSPLILCYALFSADQVFESLGEMLFKLNHLRFHLLPLLLHTLPKVLALLQFAHILVHINKLPKLKRHGHT